MSEKDWYFMEPKLVQKWNFRGEVADIEIMINGVLYTLESNVLIADLDAREEYWNTSVVVIRNAMEAAAETFTKGLQKAKG